MPWADIAPPTSTVIDEIEPGSTQAFRGQQVTVKARVQGIPDGEQVLSTTRPPTGRSSTARVEMARPTNDYRHVAVLPAGDAALQQSITTALRPATPNRSTIRSRSLPPRPLSCKPSNTSIPPTRGCSVSGSNIKAT